MNQFLLIALRIIFGSILGVATIITTIVLSPVVLVLWVWKKLTDFMLKK